MKTFRPQKHTSPIPSASMFTSLYLQPGTTLPQLEEFKETLHSELDY